MTEQSEVFQQSLAELSELLVARYGELLTDEALYRSLGFNSRAGFNRALEQGRLPVPVFTLAHRRGRYSLTRDVARWLARKRSEALTQITGSKS